MNKEYASAIPRKRFFIEMFTRDIALEDCALDLIDNSIDALFRTERIKLFSDIAELLKPRKAKAHLPQVNLRYSDKNFTVEDNCGGIPISFARDHVFNFGHEEEREHEGQFGVYGIGLKRAIFKMGDHFEITSRTLTDAFQVSESISDWVKKDETLDDWRFEINEIDKAKKQGQAGTKVEVKELSKEVINRLKDGSFESNLRHYISTTYALFLEKDVRVTVNGKHVEPYAIPLGSSKKVTPSSLKEKYGAVSVHLLASLAERDPVTDEWKGEKAGWYIFCKGRMIVESDKTQLTGWDNTILPTWHSKYRGFIGLAFFDSDDLLQLPWTTSKRGINRESDVFQRARGEMQKITRPILTFLNKMYPSEDSGEIEQRAIAKSVKTADLFDLAKKNSQFKVKIEEEKKKTTTKISYEVENLDFDKAKKVLRHPEWKPSKVGEYTFNYFMKRESVE